MALLLHFLMLLAVVLPGPVSSFLSPASTITTSRSATSTPKANPLLSTKSSGDNGDENERPLSASSSSSSRRRERNEMLKQSANELKRLRTRTANAKIANDLFSVTGTGGESLVEDDNAEAALIELNLAGRGYVGNLAQPEKSLGNQAGEQQPIRCIFLSTPEASEDLIWQYLNKRYPNQVNQEDVLELPAPLKQEDDSLSESSKPQYTSFASTPAVPLPIPLTREKSSALKLLSFAFRGRPISKSVFLPLAPILTNRDGALWDNLPWTEWTIDPKGNTRDKLTGKVIPKKYLLGKRDAYNRMVGRDWYGRSLSAGNRAAFVKYTVEDRYDEWVDAREKIRAEREEQEEQRKAQKSLQAKQQQSSSVGDNEIIEYNDFDDFNYDNKYDDDAVEEESLVMESSLAARILQLQSQEAAEELAEAERQYALLKRRLKGFTNDDVVMANYAEIQSKVNAVQTAVEQKNATDAALQTFVEAAASDQPVKRTELEALVNNFLTDLVSEKIVASDDDDKNGSVLPQMAPLQDATAAAEAFVADLRAQENLMDDLNEIINREGFGLITQVKDRVVDFLDGVIEKATRNAPPYRGAMGYSPQVDTKEEMFKKALLPYRSPYDLLLEIIQEQLNADVIACVLENSSLFPGTLVLEGCVVLRRRGKVKTIQIGGEDIELEDRDDDFGNDGVTMGETLIVECAGDEAVGLALSAGLPVSVERQVWRDVVTDVTLQKNVQPLEEEELESVMNTIPPVQAVSKGPRRVVVTTGGEALVGGGGASNKKSEEEETEDNSSADDDENNNVITIESVADYDALDIPSKAQFVLSSENAEGKKLPRPRVLKRFDQNLAAAREKSRASDGSSKSSSSSPYADMRTTLSPLDEMVVPLIDDDEVKFEILIRDAKVRENKNDLAVLESQLETFREKKKEQEAKEKEKANRRLW